MKICLNVKKYINTLNINSVNNNFISMSGCIILNLNMLKKTKKDIVYHYTACGPLALEKALRAFGEDVDRKGLSREIYKQHQEQAVALIHYEAMQITWPSEIKAIQTSMVMIYKSSRTFQI